MIEKSQEYLRLALAATAILIGLSVAYHYLIYVPQQDREAKLADDTKATTEAQQVLAKQAANEKASSERRANYHVCMASAQTNYSGRWNGLCRKKSEDAEKNRTQCISNGGTAASCLSYYPELPASDCLLPHEVSDSFDAMLKADQKQCLDEARAGILDTPEDSLDMNAS